MGTNMDINPSSHRQSSTNLERVPSARDKFFSSPAAAVEIGKGGEGVYRPG